VNGMHDPWLHEQYSFDLQCILGCNGSRHGNDLSTLSALHITFHLFAIASARSAGRTVVGRVVNFKSIGCRRLFVAIQRHGRCESWSVAFRCRDGFERKRYSTADRVARIAELPPSRFAVDVADGFTKSRSSRQQQRLV
jgi:hypothetical protein